MPVNGYAVACRTCLVFLFAAISQSAYTQTINENPLTCNTPVNWVAGSGPSVSILTGTMPGSSPLVNVQRWTGNFGTNLASVTGTDKIIDSNTTSNFGSFNYLLSVSGGTRVTVQSKEEQIPAGYFAGFVIRNTALVNANLLGTFTVKTYLDNTLQESVGTSSGLLNASLINPGGKTLLGFIASKPFNRLMLEQNQTVNIGVVSATEIYNPVLEKFCENQLACNKLTALTTPAYPVYINGQRTGIDAATCVGCSLSDVQNLLKDSTAATLTMPATIGATASVAIANAMETYPAESFAGFDVASATLLSASALASVRITLYNNNQEVQSGTGEALMAGAETAVVNGAAGRQIIGIVSREAFDEIRLTIRNTAGADLGQIQIYNAYVQTRCMKAAQCNFSKLVSNTDDGAVIDAAQTGVNGGVCAACKVSNAWNAVSQNTDDYASLYNTGSALVQSSLAVAMPAYTFPAGAFAGFSIRKNNFPIAAGLFQYLTITTYNDGVLQELKSGNSLIDLRAFMQITGNYNTAYIPGFYATKPFDEVKITVGALATALDQYIDVYGAYIDTKGYAASIDLHCNTSNPDIAVTAKRIPVNGNLSYNDNIQMGFVTYGANITVPEGYSNPSSAVPVIQTDGSYTFVADTAGIYQFRVSVCYGEDNSCAAELFTITVVDAGPKDVKNPPVANTDIAATAYNTPAEIHILANDATGSPELQIVPATVTVTDLNGDSTSGNTSRGGTATINTATGNITYTPPTGFVGIDTIRYTVCDNAQMSKCGSAYAVVKVLTPTAANSVTAADDFYMLSFTPGKTNTLTISADSGALANDSDPEGHSITAVLTDTTITGKGRLQMAADGSFTFTAEPGFMGTVVIPYKIYDDGSPAASAGGSIHIMVKAYAPDLTPTLTLTPNEMIGTTNVAMLIDINEINMVKTAGLITVYLTKNTLMPLQFNETDTAVNGVPVQNSLWTVDATSNSSYYILKTMHSMEAGGRLTVGLKGVFSTPFAGRVNATCTILKFSGGEEYYLNNVDAVPIFFYPAY